MEESSIILTHEQIERKIHRIAFQIYERFFKEEKVVIAGINGNGYELAKLIAGKLDHIGQSSCSLVHIALNKQDPRSNTTLLTGPEEDIRLKPVIIVDDVLNTGKTMVYAVSAFIREGSSVIKTAVLADRNHKKFPIAADYVGISLATTLHEHLSFEINENNMCLTLR
jgi:pyrimidine operon attenuation protein/uracil phosphoribosyltransferase